MRTRSTALFLVALAASPAIVPPRPCAAQAAASGEKEKDAEVHFRRGVELYKEGDAAGALVEFRRAYDLAPNYRILYNIGQTYYQLQRYADAVRALRAYVAASKGHLTAARRASVESDLRMLSAHVADIDVRVNVEGAQIAVDDDPAGVSPLREPYLVSIGRRKVSATKGDRRVERFVDVATGDHASVVLELPPEAAPPPAPAASAPAPPAHEPPAPPAPPPPPAATAVTAVPVGEAPPASGNSAARWILWGTTGVLAAGTAVTGALTLKSKSDLSAQLNTFPGNGSQIDAARNRGKSLALVTDVLSGAAVVAAGLALWVTLSGRSAPTGKADVEVGAGPGELLLRGRFQ
jgi:hypothetical protein